MVSLSNSRGGGGIIIKLQRRGWYYQTPEEGVVLSNSRGGGGIKSQVSCVFFKCIHMCAVNPVL